MSDDEKQRAECEKDDAGRVTARVQQWRGEFASADIIPRYVWRIPVPESVAVQICLRKRHPEAAVLRIPCGSAMF